jgi:hypothetical protein
LDGVDLAPYLSGQDTTAPHDTLYWSMEGPNASHWAVRHGDMKLIYEDAHPETMSNKKDRVVERKLQLYNLAVDPNETNDLSDAQPQDVQRLKAIYQAFMAECKPSLYTPEVEKRHKAALAARERDPALKDVDVAVGSPGHWFGRDADGRANEEGVFPPLPAAGD